MREAVGWLTAGLKHVPSTVIGLIFGALAWEFFFNDAHHMRGLAERLDALGGLVESGTTLTGKLALLALALAGLGFRSSWLGKLRGGDNGAG